MNRGRSPAMRLVAESFMPPIDPTIDRAYGAACAGAAPLGTGPRQYR